MPVPWRLSADTYRTRTSLDMFCTEGACQVVQLSPLNLWRIEKKQNLCRIEKKKKLGRILLSCCMITALASVNLVMLVTDGENLTFI